MPARTAVPFFLFVNVTPFGSAPDSVIVAAAGWPLVLIVNDPFTR